VQADAAAVDEDLAAVAETLEFEEDLLAGGVAGQREMLAVPGDASAEVVDVPGEGVVLVPRPRERHGLPGRVVERGRFGPLEVNDEQPPAGVEVVACVRGG